MAIVRSDEADAPSARAIMVTVPAVAPVTVVLNTPRVELTVLVVPVEDPKVTLPPSVDDWVSVTVAPLTPLPPAFFAVMVRVILSVPAVVSVVPLDASVTVEPTTST